MPKELSETRKADRPKIAEMVAAAARAAGATVTVAPVSYDPASIGVSIDAPGGGRVNVHLEPNSIQPNVHVLSWTIDLDSDDRFNPGYWPSINPFHHSKATRIAHGTEELCSIIAADVAACASGKAYSEELKLSHIAKSGTAAERRARFGAWMDELDSKKDAAA